MNGLYRLQVLVDLADRLSGPISGILGKLEQFEMKTVAVDRAVQTMAAGAGIAAIGIGLAAPLALSANEAIRLEAAFADVRKVVNFTPDYGPKQLLGELRGLSKQIPLTTTELTQIAAAGGQAGIELQDLAQFTQDTAKTAVALDMSAAQAGDTLAQLRNIFRTNEQGVMDMADSVNYLSNITAAKAPDILETLRRVGPTGAMFRMAGNDVAAFTAAMLSTGRQPEVVATGLNQLIMRLGTASIQSKDFQRGLSYIGMSATGLERAIKKDATGAILGFLETVKASKDPARALGYLFGAQYSDDIGSLLNVLPDVQSNLSKVSDRANVAGSVSKEFANRINTTEAKLTLFKNALVGVGSSLGATLLPPLNKVLEVGTNSLNWVGGLIDRFPLLGAVISVVLGTLAFLAVGLGVGVTALGALGFASAQAWLGIAFLRETFDQAAFSAYDFAGRIDRMIGRIAALGGPIPAARAGILSLAGAVRAFSLALLTNPIFLIIAAVVGLGAAFVWAWGHVQEFRNQVLIALKPLRAAWFEFLAALSQLGVQFQPVVDFMRSAFGQVGGILDALGFAFGWVLGFILTLTIGIFARIGASVLQALTGVVNYVRGWVNIIVGFFTGDFDRVRTGARQVMDGLVSIITAPLRMLGVDAVAWGKSIIDGLVNGLKNGVAAVGNVMGNIASTVKGVFTGETQIRSPSRLFHYYGTMLTAGLVAGIGAGTPAVADAVAGLAGEPVMEASAFAVPPVAGAGASAAQARAKETRPEVRVVIESIVLGEAKDPKWQVAELQSAIKEAVLLALEEAALEEGYGG